MSLHPALFAFRKAMADASLAAADVLGRTFRSDATIRMCHPFGDITGADMYDALNAPLLHAMPDLERRDMIAITGNTITGNTIDTGQGWIGCMGNYMGTMIRPWLNIPPKGHLTHMRYHEFFKLEDGKMTEAQIIWDIPEVMMQARAWPMAPQLGKFFVPPPRCPKTGCMPMATENGTFTRSCRCSQTCATTPPTPTLRL